MCGKRENRYKKYERESRHMAAEMMYADGKATMISKDGDAYGTNFRYNNIEYEKDMQSGRCYLLDEAKNFTKRMLRPDGMVRRRVSSVAYETARTAAIEAVERAAAGQGQRVG